jgi:hypothetical protein
MTIQSDYTSTEFRQLYSDQRIGDYICGFKANFFFDKIGIFGCQYQAVFNENSLAEHYATKEKWSSVTRFTYQQAYTFNHKLHLGEMGLACKDCHNARGVAVNKSLFTRRHPVGWNNRLSPNFHKRKARLRLSSCTSCHTRNDCKACHIFRKR